VGIAIGLGFLAKYSALLWFVGLAAFMIAERRSLRGLVVAVIVALLFTIPVIIWNAQHGWVSFHHVARQTGAAGGTIGGGNFFELLGSQIGLLNPMLVVFIVLGVASAIRSSDEASRRQLRFLLWGGLPFLAMTLAISAFTKVQPNWPAPASFTLVILAAYFISTRMRDPQSWERWRGWFWGMIAIGLAAQVLARDISILFPLMQRIGIDPAKIDVHSRGRGWSMLGRRVSEQLDSLGADAFVLCDDYMQAAEMAFYVSGQPTTYCAGSYYSNNPKRLTQWDIWPARQLDAPSLIGRSAVFVGKGSRPPPDIVRAFDRIEPIDPIPVVVRGVPVKSFKAWRCYGFKGMTRPSASEY
jgi:hypothetical protein